MAAFTGRTLLLTLAVILTFSPCTVSISPRDYDSMTRVLRSHGYNLICNAMATSDLQYQLLTRPPNTSFTIFAPTDASLFALDMIQTASSYTDTLRLHVVPFRLSFFELRSISNGSILPTLLPSTALLLSTTDPLAVSGVEVVLPGLYYSRRLAVHGLAGIFSLASVVNYTSHLKPKASFASGGADTVAPLKTASSSNRTNLSPAATPLPEAMSPVTIQTNRTGSADLSPSPTGLENNSTASDQTPSASLPPARSVPERARVLLMKTTDSDSDSDLEGDEISEKSQRQMEADGEVKKCGSLDGMTIDCFVAEDGVGLEQLSHGRLVRAVA